MSAEKYHHGNLKEAMIAAGLSILETDGLAGLSLRKCAERVGTSHTAPKNHFGNMTGLLTALATRGYGQLHDFMTRDCTETTSPIERRNNALEGYVNFALAQPALFSLMFSNHKINRDDADLGAQIGACFLVLRDNSENLGFGNIPATDNPRRNQILFWSLVHGFAQLKISGSLRKDDMKSISILELFPQPNSNE